MYKNFIFDVYGTLVDIHTNEYADSTWEKLRETLDFYGVYYTADELRETYFGSCDLQITLGKKLYKYPEVDVVEVFRHIFENKNKKAGRSLATHIAQQFRAFTTEYVRAFDGVAETLKELKRAGKKLYILSNAQTCFTKPELTRLGLLKFFNGVVYSSDEGCAKPDPILFDRLIEKYGLLKKECVYIGNDPETDVDGARNAKIDCLWLKTSHTTDAQPRFTPKYVINNGDFTQIPDLLLKR